MKQHIIYECENCGKKSKDKIEIIKCEAAHLNLSDEDYQKWEELKQNVRYASHIVGTCKNEQTDKALDNAIVELMEFEKLHGIEGGSNMSDKKMKRDDLGNRMKTFYEQIPKTKLIRRTPVIIRIDGKAFHTFTRGFKRPFDDVLIKTMQETTKYLCENVQGCVLGYTQSDEISLVLIDYQRFETSAWFDYEIQKMCSISASMATMAFNRIFGETVSDWICTDKNLLDTYFEANYSGAMFDARVFNIPREEVTNCIYWRQLDASRNSIQMVGQANFSHKELQNKSCNDIQDMLMTQKGINWNDLPTYQKRGSCVVRNKVTLESDGVTEKCMLRDPKQGYNNWIIDKNIPIFKGEGREYIEKLINVGEE